MRTPLSFPAQARAGALDAGRFLVHALTAHRTAPAAATELLRALANLTFDANNRVRGRVDAGPLSACRACPLYRRPFRALPRSETVRPGRCATARGSPLLPQVQAQGTKALDEVLGCMRQHQANAPLQEAAAAAVAHLVAGSAACQARTPRLPLRDSKSKQSERAGAGFQLIHFTCPYRPRR